MQHLRVTALYARARQELLVSSEAGRSALLLRHQGRGNGATPQVQGGLQQLQTATGAREGLSIWWSGGLQVRDHLKIADAEGAMAMAMLMLMALTIAMMALLMMMMMMMITMMTMMMMIVSGRWR